jgi:predicted nuclease with RNAse H fold
VTGRAVGIDLGAQAMHVVVVEGGAVVDGAVLDDVDAVVERCAGADRIGIDAPAAPSTGVHGRDGGISPKFAGARCGEIAAGVQLGVWVPWVTPEEGRCPPWMRLGFALWSALRAAGHDPIEVYPAGSVWLEQRRWPPKKTTVAGLAARRALLGRFLELPPFVELWSHDGIDAALAAAVAAEGDAALVARHDDPACDGSSIWFLDPSRAGIVVM